MCGRYSFAQLSTEVEKRFKIHVDGNTYVAKYNCAPGQKLGVITNNNPNELSLYKWGLIPPWAKDETLAFKMINARSESLQEKPAFKNALKSKRCIIPATGFYEWKKNGKQKTPHYIRLKNHELFSFAGLWEEWKDKKGVIKNTFTIITTEANQMMKPLHHRMPVILPQHMEEEWLGNNNEQQTQKILLPFDSHKMESFEISSKVNKVIHEGKDLITPFKSDEQLSLF